jgi:ribosomal protein S18 acetylase RimI-like enzyme
MLNLLIAPAIAEDIPALVDLVNSAYRGERSRRGWTTEADFLEGDLRTDIPTLSREMTQPDALIVKCSNEMGAILGCVYLQGKMDALYLGMLTVDPNYQNLGIGKKLLQAAADHAKKYHYTSIQMNVISLRAELIGWYERQGYHKTGEKKPFLVDPVFGIPQVPLDFVVLSKQI